jgi:glycosyltransferase involved in cell wall biosynthesis
MKYRLHFLGLPHVNTSRLHNACAYTSKIVKGIKMLGSRGHECFNYGNEGSTSDYGEVIPILTEDERASWFGSFDRHRLYDLRWDPNEAYWKLFNTRAIVELKKRVRKGDFIMTLAGNCQQPIGNAFPGSYAGTATEAMMVEWGIGYYGTFSRYRVFESHAHREWMMGNAGNKGESNDDAVIGNFFDVDEFNLTKLPRASIQVEEILSKQPYFLYVGRVIQDKGVFVAAEVTRDLKRPLVIAGQGWLPALDAYPHVIRFGHANIADRAHLMHNAKANFLATHYREPFGGTAVEAQLCGCPAITTDHAVFLETVERPWRCATHREFCEAAQRALTLSKKERQAIQTRAECNWSLEAIAPLYERYLGRMYARWGGGWYEMRDLEEIRL